MTAGSRRAAVDDALTVLAALLHGGWTPDPERLATALGWAPERVAGVLREAGWERLTRTQHETLDR